MRADEEDFRAYCAQALPALLRFGYALTGRRDAASDLVQTALTRTFAAWWRVERRDNPDAYVRRTMLNTVTNDRRRRGREVPVPEMPDHQLAGDVPTAVDDRLLLWPALLALPPRQRAVIVLRYYEDRSEAEIADLLNCSAGTVKSQASKALARLRAALPDSDEVIT